MTNIILKINFVDEIDLSIKIEIIKIIDIFTLKRLISFVKLITIVNVCVNFNRNTIFFMSFRK